LNSSLKSHFHKPPPVFGIVGRPPHAVPVVGGRVAVVVVAGAVVVVVGAVVVVAGFGHRPSSFRRELQLVDGAVAAAAGDAELTSGSVAATTSSARIDRRFL
jgi:hypothetical protein